MELLMRPFRTSRAKIIWIMGHSTTSVASLVESWHKTIRFPPSGCLDTRGANRCKCFIFRMKKSATLLLVKIMSDGTDWVQTKQCASEFTRHQVMDGTAPAATLRKWPDSRCTLYALYMYSAGYLAAFPDAALHICTGALDKQNKGGCRWVKTITKKARFVAF